MLYMQLCKCVACNIPEFECFAQISPGFGIQIPFLEQKVVKFVSLRSPDSQSEVLRQENTTSSPSSVDVKG